MATNRIVVGMAADRGLEYGIELLRSLRDAGLESHVVLTSPAAAALGPDLAVVRELSGQLYATDNQAARISSGSFLTRGMVVAPCSSEAVATVTRGLASNLVFRAADVTLKEGRPLLLAVPGPAPPGESLERARGVPGLDVTRLGGPVGEAVEGLLAQLGVERVASVT